MVALVMGTAMVTACSTTRRPAGSEAARASREAAASGAVTVPDGAEAALPLEPEGAPAPARRSTTTLAPGESIWVQSGKSRILRLPRPVTRVSIGDPELAGIVVLGPRTVLINAKRLPKDDQPVATGDPAAAARGGAVTADTLTPEPRIAETTLVFWSDARPATRGRRAAAAAASEPTAHTLFVADFIREQVLLEVTVAELNRTAMEEHGIDFRQIGTDFVSAYFMGGGAGPSVPGLATTVPPIPPVPLLPLTTTANSPTYAFRLPKDDITAFIKLLQTDGLATVLAQPKLLALSGQKAVFQVGGEIPIRIVTGFVADIEYKPFGTLINFVPRVSEEGDIVLTVTPEVSQPDFNSPVEGIPTFRTRRASTSARLRNGETLVIGGLLQTVRREEVRGVPYLKDIPLAGYVFRDSSYTDEVTELVVVVRPRLVRPLPPGAVVPLPVDRGPLTNEEIRTKPDPAEASRPRVPGLP
jgi:pilus assembly protein CpaC